ncbi:DUF2059 domain-containing protein [Magnetococcales bacterium HHB-1]
MPYKLTFFSLFLLLFSFNSWAETTPEAIPEAKAALIREMIELTNADKIGILMGNAIMKQMIVMLKKTHPDADPKAFTVVQNEVSALLTEELHPQGNFMKSLYPLYHKYFTADELKWLNQFYKTPLGKKIISQMPQLMQESMAISRRWSQNLMPKLQKRIKAGLKAEGIKLEK